MFNFIKLVNLFILLVVSLVSLIHYHTLVFALTLFLWAAVLQTKNPTQMWIYFAFNEYFSSRYIEICGLNFPSLYKISNVNILQKHFAISVLFLTLIIISLLISSLFEEKLIKKSENQDSFVKKLSILSIFLFAFPVFLGDYKIGREVKSIFSIISLRFYEFTIWFQPAIFQQSLIFKILSCLILASASFYFGSKAFLINLINLYIINALLSNKDLNYKILFLGIFSVIISILLYRSFEIYRIDNSIKSLFNFFLNNFDFSFAWVKDTLSFIGFRFAGLDTLAAFSESNFHFTLYDFLNEISLAANRFLLFFKISIPNSYVPSEYFTALHLHKIDSFLNSGYGLTHTDSMFGISRLVIADFGTSAIFLSLLFIFPFIVKFKNYYTNQLSKIYFYSSFLLGGSYEETVRIFVELLLICVILELNPKFDK